MQSVKNIPLICLAVATLVAVSTALPAGAREPRKTLSFDADWRFRAGEIDGAERPEYNDASWLKVNVPHDWSIEGLALSTTKVDDPDEIPVVRGEWKFSKGDDLRWKDPAWNDVSWQNVNLPATWEEHSNYTEDNVFGWFRREVTIPADLQREGHLYQCRQDRRCGRNLFQRREGRRAWVNFRPTTSVPGTSTVDTKCPTNSSTTAARTASPSGCSTASREAASMMTERELWMASLNRAHPEEAARDTSTPARAGTGRSSRLPGNVQGKRVFIEFDGVYMDSDVWLNGVASRQPAVRLFELSV